MFKKESVMKSTWFIVSYRCSLSNENSCSDSLALLRCTCVFTLCVCVRVCVYQRSHVCVCASAYLHIHNARMRTRRFVVMCIGACVRVLGERVCVRPATNVCARVSGLCVRATLVCKSQGLRCGLLIISSTGVLTVVWSNSPLVVCCGWGPTRSPIT